MKKPSTTRVPIFPKSRHLTWEGYFAGKFALTALIHDGWMWTPKKQAKNIFWKKHKVPIFPKYIMYSVQIEQM
jgi:hypothetical protein